MEGEDLKSVGDQETRETNAVEGTKDPDEDDLCVTSAGVGLARVLVDGSGDGPASKRADHTEHGNEEQRATSKPVNVQGGGDGDNQIKDGLSARDGQLGVLVLDTGTFVDDVDVVGQDGVARVLGDDTERDDDCQSPAVALGAEKVHVCGGLVGVLLGVDDISDLAVLELDGGVVGVAASVPLGEDVQGLFVTVLVDQVTGRLGDPPDAEKLDDRRRNLEEGD